MKKRVKGLAKSALSLSLAATALFGLGACGDGFGSASGNNSGVSGNSSGGNSGNSSSGGTGTEEKTLASELIEALVSTELKGISVRADVVDEKTQEDDTLLYRSVTAVNGQADFTRDGVYADVEMVTESEDYTYAQFSYIRGDAAYLASWGSGDASFSYASVAEFRQAVSSKEYLFEKNNVESVGAETTFVSPFVMKVLKNIPQVLGGVAETTEDGYSLTYNVAQSAERLYEMVRLLAAAVDADKTMTVGEALEYAPVKGFVQILLKGVTAQETADFAKLMVAAQGGEMTDEDFYAVFPRPAAGDDAWAYLEACLASETLSEAFFGAPEALTTLNAYELFCEGLGLDTAENPSLQEMVIGFWANLRDEAENNDPFLQILFPEAAAKITVLFDADKTPLALEAEVKFGGELDDGESLMIQEMTFSARVDFLTAAPDLLSLTGGKCIAGYTYEDVTETQTVNVVFDGGAQGEVEVSLVITAEVKDNAVSVTVKCHADDGGAEVIRFSRELNTGIGTMYLFPSAGGDMSYDEQLFPIKEITINGVNYDDCRLTIVSHIDDSYGDRYNVRLHIECLSSDGFWFDGERTPVVETIA